MKPTALPARAESQKLPLNVALVLDESLTGYTYKYSMLGDKWVFPFGPALKEHAVQVARHCFREVTVHSSADAAANTADAVLQPRPLKTDQTQGVFAWDDRNMILVLEWTLRDRANRNVVWLATVDGKATHTGGNLFTWKSNQRKLLQELFDNLTTKTVETIDGAEALKRHHP